MKRFRPNVAAILQRADGKILVGERVHIPGAWQFPQGGVDEGEDLLAAVKREIEEEIGVPASCYEIAACRTGYRYLFAPEHRRKGKWDGQEQTYFLCSYSGEGKRKEFTLDGEHEEFSRVKWIEPGEFKASWLPDFKLEVYRQVLADFFGAQLD